MIITARRNLQVSSNPTLNCSIWKKSKGYLAYFDCEKLKAKKLSPTWEARFPPLSELCLDGTYEGLDPRCAMPVAGFKHPHVVMISDYVYALHIDI